MDYHLSLRIFPLQLLYPFRLYPGMRGAEAWPENHLFARPGRDVMPEILVRDKYYLSSIQAFYDPDRIGGGTADI